MLAEPSLGVIHLTRGQAKCSVRGIHLPCKQRFRESRWGGAGRSPARIFFIFFHIFRSFLLRTWPLDQQGPGGAPGGFPVYTLHLNSDAGYAVVPLALLGAPVSIGEALG